MAVIAGCICNPTEREMTWVGWEGGAQPGVCVRAPLASPRPARQGRERGWREGWIYIRVAVYVATWGRS